MRWRAAKGAQTQAICDFCHVGEGDRHRIRAPDAGRGRVRGVHKTSFEARAGAAGRKTFKRLFRTDLGKSPCSGSKVIRGYECSEPLQRFRRRAFGPAKCKTDADGLPRGVRTTRHR